MYFHRTIVAIWLAVLPGSAGSGHEGATSRLNVEIAGNRFSIQRDYVISWNPRGRPHPNSRERLWVAFSDPSYEPLGFGWANGRIWESAAREREELRHRGENIVELILTPDDGRPILWNRDSLERRCAQIGGRFEESSLSAMSGYSCLLADHVGKRYFPINARLTHGVLVCPLDEKPCELQARGLSDKILRRILYIDQHQVLNSAELLDAAETFIRERME